MAKNEMRAILLALLLLAIVAPPSFRKPDYRYQSSGRMPRPVFFGTHFRTLQGLIAEAIEHNGGLPRGDATLLVKSRHDLQFRPSSTHRVQEWNIETVEIKDYVTGEPECQVVMETRVRYGDEEEAILRWTRLDNCFHLGPIVISNDSGRPWGLRMLQASQARS